jgi:PPOX class probable F420-dependent enzyme
MTMDSGLRQVLDGTPIAHIATLLSDGAPHTVPVWVAAHGDHVAVLTGPTSQKARNLRRDARVAVSLTHPDDPTHPISLRGEVVEWLTGETGWEVVDRMADKYLGRPYPRDQERVVMLIDVRN